ncbi:MAG: hypothetical protein HY320_12710 [Armatimonadetes bacterium]|nr:hypothetical protein [Armatimonadota bacterium]
MSARKHHPAARHTAAAVAEAVPLAWSPLSLFLLCTVPWAIIWLPAGILASGVLAALNWSRLGHPERAWQPLAMALVSFATPFIAQYAGLPGFPFVHMLDLRAVVLAQIACWTGPSFALHSQREAWLAHVARGGKAASIVAPLLAAVPLSIWAIFLRLATVFATPLP